MRKIAYGGRLAMSMAVLGLALAAPHSAKASPFCAITAAGKQCAYASVEACKKEIGENGVCIVNSAERPAIIGNAPYCAVRAWGTQCIFKDSVACRQTIKEDGACMANPRR